MNRNYYIIGAVIGVLVGSLIIFVLLQSGVVKNNISNAPVAVGTQLPAEEVAGAKSVATGTSPVATSGVVVSSTGRVADNSATPRSPEAPQESKVLKESEVPSQAIKITGALHGGFLPSSFTVKAGQAVTLALSSGDGFSYVFKFDDPILKAVAIGASGNEVSAITFNAPAKKGEYTFYSDVPGHRDAGLVGKMIVQ